MGRLQTSPLTSKHYESYCHLDPEVLKTLRSDYHQILPVNPIPPDKNIFVFFSLQLSRVKTKLNPTPPHVSGPRRPDLAQQEQSPAKDE